MPNRVLVVGWFSFENFGATLGDIVVRDRILSWLESTGMKVDVAVAPPFADGVMLALVDELVYSHLVFVCGPMLCNDVTERLIRRFAHCKRIAINVSMIDKLSTWNPFHVLLERDSDIMCRPDICISCSDTRRVQVVGVTLVQSQPEYGKRVRHALVNGIIKESLKSIECAVVPIDTRLDYNSNGLRTVAEIESLIAKMDVLITTRLHGAIFAIKNGVPPVVIDPIAGGAKVAMQARAIRWPVLLLPEELSSLTLRSAFDYCTRHESRTLAASCRDEAALDVDDLRRCFVAEFINGNL